MTTDFQKVIMARPVEYKPEVADKVIAFMKEGMSIEEVCYELDICKQTFYNWCKKYPELMDAKKKGIDFSCGWWMKEGRRSLRDTKFNYTGWYMNMKNRFGWADKTDLKADHSGEITIVRKVITKNG